MGFFAKEQPRLSSSGGAIPSLTAYGETNIGVCSTLEKCRRVILVCGFDSHSLFLCSLGGIGIHATLKT